MSRHFAALVFVVLGVLSPGLLAATPDEQELLRVEALLCRAFESGDAATLRRYLDKRFTLTSSRGEVTDYEQNVAEVAKRDPAYTVFRNHDQKIRVYGNAAIITGITTIKGASGSQAFAGDFQYTDTWVRGKSGWKLAASHASRVGH